MKNRKFIKKIIFSILLLFCVCVPFLVHKNNVKAATDITNLTNTKWRFGEYINNDYSNTFNYSINFNLYIASNNTDNTRSMTNFILTSIGGNYNVFDFEVNGQSGFYYGYNSRPRINSNYRDGFEYVEMTILGGSDITNTSLIAWLDANATLVSGGTPEEPEPDPVYTISGQYQFNEEITWLWDISEAQGELLLPFYTYNLDNSNRVNYDYMVNQYNEVDDTNLFMYANGTASGTFTGSVAGYFTTSTTVRMRAAERIIYFYTAEVDQDLYNWLNNNGQFINDPTLDPNNPDNPDSGNNPNNPNNPDFGTDTVRQIVNQVNAFLGIQILPGLSFRDILLICIALPLLIYILKVFLGG